MISWVNGRNYENLLQLNTICFFYKQLFFYISLKNCNIAEVVEEKPKNSPRCQKGKRKQPQ